MIFLLSIALLILTPCVSIFSMEITNTSPQSLSSVSQHQSEPVLLNRHSAFNDQDQEGKTLLMRAVELNRPDATKICLKNNANPWIKDNNKECSFHAVCKTGNLEIARQLLKKHGDVNAENDKEGWKWLYTPGSKFSPYSKSQGINVLFSNYQQAHNSPLFKQLLLGDVDEINKILDKNPESINQMVKTDHCALTTPITWAVHLDDEKLVEHLLKKGAHIEIPDNGESQNWNAYDWAANSPTIKALMMPYRDNSPDIAQPKTRLFDAVKRAYENREINYLDSKGLAPLHWACIRGNSEAIASLIDKNADVNIVDKDNERSGLRWLLRMHTGSVKKAGRQITTATLLPCFFLLASAGADPNVPDIHGNSVVDWIPCQGFNETEKTLVNKVLKAKDQTHSERKLLLEDIHSLQQAELKNKCMADSDARKLSVKKHPTRSNSFKDIYKKYIGL
jgi:ankyrin repeat protein